MTNKNITITAATTTTKSTRTKADTHYGTPINQKRKMKKKNKPNEYINNNSTKAKVKDDDGEWGKHRTKTCNVDSVCAHVVHFGQSHELL